MKFKVNLYPSRQKPDPVRQVYEPLTYYYPIEYEHESRYKNQLCLRSEHVIHPNKFDIQASQQSRSHKYHQSKARQIISAADTDRFHKVDNVTENRIDLIALKYYNSASLWWVIAEANTDILFDSQTIPQGTVLRIPLLSRIYAEGVI